MADHDRRRRRGEDQQAAADLIADLALYPAGGDGSSSSDQSSPSNNDQSLSPRSTAGSIQDGSLFFDSAAALSSFFSASAGPVGPGAEGAWPTSVAFSTALTPAVMHAASPTGFASTPNRAGGFGGNAAMSRDFWEASPGIPSPMGMDENGQQQNQMTGLEASSPPRHSAEFSFGSLVAEDQCGPSLAPSPQVSSSASSSFSPPLPTSSIASSAFSFFNPAGLGSALSRFYPSFGASANGTAGADPRVTASQMPTSTSFTMDAFPTAESSLNLDPAWFAANSLPTSPTTTGPSAGPSRESSRGPTVADARVNGLHPAFPPPAAPVSKVQDEPQVRAPSDLELAIPSVAFPPRTTPGSWGDARLLILGIAKDGAKSRVETQVKISLVLVRPKRAGAQSEPTGDDQLAKLVDAAVAQDGSLVRTGHAADSFERIGSWANLKLPACTAIKRKARKLIRTGVPPEESLFLEARVTRATEPYDEVFCCANCQARERKRTQRKREARVRPAQEVSSDEGDKEADDDDKRKIVVFNSGEWLDFGTGEITLPARITCYCRHVKEKQGFRVTITLRDHAERIVASATSPAIMITDDHKAAASKTSRPASDAEAPKSVNGHENKPTAAAPPRNGTSSVRRTSGNASDGNDAKRQRRAGAPYDPSQRNARPRGGHLSRSPSFAMTPLMTPLTTSKPGSPSQTRIGPFPRTAPASLAPSPNTSDTLPLPPLSAPAVNGDAAAGHISAIEAALRAVHAPLQADGDIQMQEGSASSQESSPNASGQSGAGLDLRPSPRRHHPSIDSFSSNGPSSATSLDLHNQVNGAAGPSGFSPQQQPPPWLSGYSPLMSDPFASRQSSAEAMPPPAQPPSVPSPGWGTETPRNSADAGAQPPRIKRLIPCEGPMQGGIEITILGEGFFPGITVVFGDTPAVPTHMWSGSTLVCTLPPSASPGPCVVSFRGVPITVQSGSGVQVFTYVDNSDQKLMELALQVVGLQMTGRIQDARNVAMRIVGENGNSSGEGSGTGGSPSSSSGSGPGASSLSSLAATLATAADSIMSSPTQSGPGSRRTSSADLRGMGHQAAGGNDRSFESIIIRFLTLIDFHDPGISDRDVDQPICLANAQGHTLLHLSVMLGFHKLVSYLIRHDIDVNARDRNGFTPLHFAALGGKVTITRMLLQAGAGTYFRNCAARTALDLARDRGQVDVVDLFLSFTSRSADGGRRKLSRTHSEASSLASSRRSSFAALPLSAGAASDEDTSSGGGDSDEAWDPSDDEDAADDGSDIERRLSRTPSVASLATGFFSVGESKEAEAGIPDAIPISDDDRPPPPPVRQASGDGWLPRKLRKSLPAPKAPSALSKLRLTPSISGITYIPAYTMYGLSAFSPKTWRWSDRSPPSTAELQEKRAGAWRALYGQGFDDDVSQIVPPALAAGPSAAQGQGAGARSAGKLSKTQVQAKLARRLGYTPETIDESVLDAFAYHDSKIRSLKKDKTLWLFWLPILLVALAYATFEAYTFLSPRVSELLPSAFAAQRGWTRVY